MTILKNLLLSIIILLPLFSAGQEQKSREILSLEIKGLKKTKLSFIEDIILGDTLKNLDSSALIADIQRIINLPSIAHAYFQVFHSYENKYRVYYYLEEAFTLIPGVNLWSRSNQLWVWGQLSEYNLLGRNMLLDVFYQNNGKHSYGLNFSAPYLFGSKWGTSLSFKDLSSDEPVYFKEGSAVYEYKNRSLEGIVFYELDFKNIIRTGGSFFREEYNYVSGGENILYKPQFLLINKWLLKLNYEHYDILYYYHYLSGIRNNFNFQTVLTADGSNPAFYIFWDDIRYYKRISNKGNFAARFQIGLSTNNDSPFSPFVIDNHSNVRGVGDRIERGTGVIFANAEYRHSFYENSWAAIQGVGFVDASSWRSPGGELSDFAKSELIYVHSGIGARFILKKVFNAVLRIDYGRGLNNSRHGLVLGLGQYF
jgi:hypothetical protein